METTILVRAGALRLRVSAVSSVDTILPGINTDDCLRVRTV